MTLNANPLKNKQAHSVLSYIIIKLMATQEKKNLTFYLE